MLPFWTSYLIRTYAWMIILRDNGVLNGILQALGLIDEPLILLNTDVSVILGHDLRLPAVRDPAAVRLDRPARPEPRPGRPRPVRERPGAFLHVTLPLTMPGIIAAALLTFIPAIGDYVTPDLLGGAQTTTAAKLVQTLFTSGRDWPYGSALGFILMILTLGGTLLALRSLRREIARAEREPQPLADRLRGRCLRVPVRADRRPDPVHFNDSRRTFVWRGFTLDWYPRLFANADLLDALRVTLQVAAIAVIGSTILGSLLGLGLARLRFRGSGARRRSSCCRW